MLIAQHISSVLCYDIPLRPALAFPELYIQVFQMHHNTCVQDADMAMELLPTKSAAEEKQGKRGTDREIES
eukprot:scaffold159524_cov22-Tisochrysis_lutea.AAC.1